MDQFFGLRESVTTTTATQASSSSSSSSSFEMRKMPTLAFGHCVPPQPQSQLQSQLQSQPQPQPQPQSQPQPQPQSQPQPQPAVSTVFDLHTILDLSARAAAGKIVPKRHQLFAINRIVNHYVNLGKPGIIIGAEMGTGKTHMALSAQETLLHIVKQTPTVIDRVLARETPTGWRTAFVSGRRLVNMTGPKMIVTAPSVPVAEQWIGSIAENGMRAFLYHGPTRVIDILCVYREVDIVVTTDATLRYEFEQMTRGTRVDSREIKAGTRKPDIDGVARVWQLEDELVMHMIRRAHSNAPVTGDDVSKFGLYAFGPFLTYACDEVHRMQNHTDNAEGCSLDCERRSVMVRGSINAKLHDKVEAAMYDSTCLADMRKVPYGPHLWYYGMISGAAPTGSDAAGKAVVAPDPKRDNRAINEASTACAVLLLRRMSVFFMGLSGTPVNRKPYELAMLSILTGDRAVCSTYKWSEFVFTGGVGYSTYMLMNYAEQAVADRWCLNNVVDQAKLTIAPKGYEDKWGAARWVASTIIRMRLSPTVGLTEPRTFVTEIVIPQVEQNFMDEFLVRGSLASELVAQYKKQRGAGDERVTGIKFLSHAILAIITYSRVAANAIDVMLLSHKTGDDISAGTAKDKGKGKGKGNGKGKGKSDMTRPDYHSVFVKPDAKLSSKFNAILDRLKMDLATDLATRVDLYPVLDYDTGVAAPRPAPTFHPRAKVLIYSPWTSVLEALNGYINTVWAPALARDSTTAAIGIVRSGLFTGRTSQKQRRKILDDFASDPTLRILLINSHAGGVGLNITSAQFVYHMAPDFNQAIPQQATMRAWRMGQQYLVTVRLFVCRDTLESWVYAHLTNGKRIADGIIDGIIDEKIKPTDAQSMFRELVAKSHVMQARVKRLLSSDKTIDPETWAGMVQNMSMPIEAQIAEYKNRREARKRTWDQVDEFTRDELDSGSDSDAGTMTTTTTTTTTMRASTSEIVALGAGPVGCTRVGTSNRDRDDDDDDDDDDPMMMDLDDPTLLDPTVDDDNDDDDDNNE